MAAWAMTVTETAAPVATTYRIVEGAIDGRQDELLPLLAAHRDELATHKALMRFAPDFGKHIDLQRKGLLFVLFAYHGERLIGYSSTIICPHLHYPDLLHAHNDLLFVARPHRKGRIGLALINRTRDAARVRGAEFMTWHAKPRTALAALLPRLGCTLQDVIFGEEL